MADGQSYSSPTSSSNEVEWWSAAQTDLFTKWARSYDNYSAAFNNPYFDYFFTGQDIQVTIDGAGTNDPLPIYSMGYNIQQQKTPLYGFWSYTYDAMLRGTRIVNGAFSIVSLYPTYLTERIAQAASFRAKTVAANNMAATGLNRIRGLDDDETRIDRYWRRNFDSNLDPGQQHLFSIHPPFNFVVRYGLQETSTVIDRNVRTSIDSFGIDAMSQDYNERLVRALPGSPTDMTILLENIELTSKSVEYNVDGDPLLETYTFLARDERFLKPIDKSSLQPAVPDKVNNNDQVGMSTTPVGVGTGGGGGFDHM